MWKLQESGVGEKVKHKKDAHNGIWMLGFQANNSRFSRGCWDQGTWIRESALAYRKFYNILEATEGVTKTVDTLFNFFKLLERVAYA